MRCDSLQIQGRHALQSDTVPRVQSVTQLFEDTDGCCYQITGTRQTSGQFDVSHYQCGGWSAINLHKFPAGDKEKKKKDSSKHTAVSVLSQVPNGARKQEGANGGVVVVSPKELDEAH